MNNSGALITDRAAIQGGRMAGVVPRWTNDPNRPNQGIYAEQYSDSAIFDLMQPNATLTQVIQVLQDSDFLVAKACYTATSASFTIMIEDTSTGKSLFGKPLPGAAVLGNGQEPFEFVAPYIFRNNGSIKVTVTNNSGNVNTINIVLHGARLYQTRR